MRQQPKSVLNIEIAFVEGEKIVFRSSYTPNRCLELQLLSG